MNASYKFNYRAAGDKDKSEWQDRSRSKTQTGGPKTGNKTGVRAKQTNKTPTTSKSEFICVSQRKAVTDRGSKGCLSLETKPVYIQEHNKKDSDKNF